MEPSTSKYKFSIIIHEIYLFLIKIAESKFFKALYLFLWIGLVILGFIMSMSKTYIDSVTPLNFLFFNILGGPGTFFLMFITEKKDIILLILSCAVGMSINDSFAYLAGYFATEFSTLDEKMQKTIISTYKYKYWLLALISVSPIPFDFITFASGFLKFKFKYVFLISFFGKLIKFAVIVLGVKLLFI